MDSINKCMTANGHASLNHSLPTTTGGTGPRRSRDDGFLIWRIKYVHAGSRSGHGPMTAEIMLTESEFRSFLEHLGSNGSTVIRMQRALVTARFVTAWEEQQ